MKDFKIKKPSLDEYKKIDNSRAAMRERFRSVSEEGVEIEYLDKKFRVFKNVFWPFEDSKALVKNFQIHENDTVLDIGTGSGVIAVFSAYKGAKKVVAVDINPDAYRTAKENAKLHGFENRIEVRLSDVFKAIKDNEKFDVIVANPPFSDKSSKDYVEGTMFDEGFKFHQALFEGAEKHLDNNGRIYIAQSNFGNVEKMLELADQFGFNVEKIGEHPIANDPRVFYAFELTKNK